MSDDDEVSPGGWNQPWWPNPPATQRRFIGPTTSASANAAIATIDTLVERGAITPNAGELYHKTYATVGNLDLKTRMGLSKIVEQGGRTEVPKGFGVHDSTPLDILKAALQVVAMDDQMADAAAREKREEEWELAREKREEERELAREAREDERERDSQRREARNFRKTNRVAGLGAVAAIIAAIGADRVRDFFQRAYVFLYPHLQTAWGWATNLSHRAYVFVYLYLEATWSWLATHLAR